MTNTGENHPGNFVIEGNVWRYPGPGGWYFVNIGENESNFIRNFGDITRVGWGFVAISAKIGNTKWSTKLFPDKEKRYLIAIKADVRKKEHIKEGDNVCIEITLL